MLSVKHLHCNPRNHPKLLSQKSWYLGIQNESIARGFWNLNQSIKQKIKNLQLEKCTYITDIKIKILGHCVVFSLKQLKYSLEKICSSGQVGCKRQKSYSQINIVTCMFMHASPNLLVQLNYFKTI